MAQPDATWARARRRLVENGPRVLLAALVLDVLSWPPLLAGVLVAESTVAPQVGGAEMPPLFWPVVLAAQYLGWLGMVLLGDVITAPRRRARQRE